MKADRTDLLDDYLTPTRETYRKTPVGGRRVMFDETNQVRSVAHRGYVYDLYRFMSMCLIEQSGDIVRV